MNSFFVRDLKIFEQAENVGHKNEQSVTQVKFLFYLKIRQLLALECSLQSCDANFIGM